MKDRLTGAIILVVLIVLLVPELLSGPKGPARALGTSNSAEEQQLRSYTITLGDEARPHGESASGPAMPQAPQLESASASAPESHLPTAAAALPGSVSSSPGGETAAPASGNTTAGVPSPKATDRSMPSAAAPTRAVAANHGGGAATGHTSGPTATHPSGITRPSTTTVSSGWMVQLGVFASRQNAERLAGEVRTKGMHAAVSDVSNSGRRLYRVRVGPAADRAAAQDLQSRLKASGHSPGTLIPPS